MVKKKKRSNTAKKTASQIQQDMELFSKGVERLKELKQELLSLDTKGFAREEQNIKSKLKTVSDIPMIEREIKALRLKIDKKDKPKRKKSSKIRKDIRELKESLEKKQGQRLIGSVKDLKREVASKRGQALKKGFEDLKKVESKKGKALSEDIKGLKKEVSDRKGKALKEDIKELKRSVADKKGKAVREDLRSLEESETRKGKFLKKDVQELKKEVASKRGRALKEDINALGRKIESKRGRALKEDIDELKDDVGKVSGLKLEVRKLREEMEKKKKRRSPRRRVVKIDTEIGFLVEKDFDGFVKDIERKLSARVGDKEASFDDALKRDLEKRQRNFALKYETLISRFNRKQARLEKEIGDKYNLQVETSLKKEVDEKFNQRLSNRLHQEKGKLVGEYQKLLKENVRNQVESQRKNLRKRFEAEFAGKLRLLQGEFAKKVGSAQREDMTEKSLLKRQEQQNVGRQKNLDEMKIQLKEKEKKLEVLRKKLIEDSHKKLIEDVARKQKIVESKMRNEFKLELNRHIQEHDEVLKKKKFDLELEMEKKIKKLLS